MLRHSRHARDTAASLHLWIYGAGMAVRGLEVLGKLGLYMLTAQALGAHDSGLFFLCLTWVGLAATVARMGLDRALTRHIAAELSVGDRRAARAALVSGLLWTTLASLAAGGLTYGLAGPAARHLFGTPALAAPLELAALAIAPLTLTVVTGQALTGLHRGVTGQFVQNALWPALTLLALVAGARALDELILAMIVAMLAAGVLGLVAIALRFPAAPAGTERDGTAPLPGLWHTALPLAAVEVVQVAVGALPVLALGAFVDPAAVGAFSIAHRLSMLIWVIILSIGAIAAPAFAGSHRRGDMAELRRVNRRTRRAVTLFALPAVAVMLIFPATLLDFVGPGFGVAAPALVIMAAGQLVNCLLPCQDIVLAMTGHGHALRRINLMQFATCLVLGAGLLPLLGTTGAALVTAIAVVQGAACTTWTVYRLMPGAL